MDVTLPNGQVIRGVPEGTPKDVIMQKAISAGLASPEDFPAQQAPSQQVEQSEPMEQEQTISDQVIGGAETAATIASGVIAEPLAGLRGIYEQAIGGDAAKAIEEARQALTYQGGQESQEQLQAIGEFLQPAGEALSSAESFLGETVLDATGSPALASVAHSLPTAALELLGFKGSKRLTGATSRPTKGAVKQAITESAPEINAIKNASRAIYKEIDDSGVTIKPTAINNLVNSIESKTRRKGLDPRVTAQASGALEALKEIKGSPQPIGELDIQRNIAQKVAGSSDAGEAMLGNIMIDEIDSFMDNLKPGNLVKGDASTGKKYDAARKLWGRAKRAEEINNAIKMGGDAASGMENGIRIELNKILRNKKRSKYFSEKELDAMRDVVRGDFTTNMAKLVGRFGLSEGRATNVLTSLGGVGLGATAGGAMGAIAVPVVGKAAKELAQKLTTNKAQFINKVSRAGNDADKIAKAYLTSVPKAKRNPKDLSDLLLDPNINLRELEGISNKVYQDAVDIAKGKRYLNLAGAAIAGASAEQVRQESQQLQQR